MILTKCKDPKATSRTRYVSAVCRVGLTLMMLGCTACSTSSSQTNPPEVEQVKAELESVEAELKTTKLELERTAAALEKAEKKMANARDKRARTWPICGVVVARDSGKRLSLLVPHALQEKQLARYRLTDSSLRSTPRPVSVSEGWWICVTEGRVLKEPDPEQPQFTTGRIEVLSYTYDQGTGEAGME